MLRRLQDAVAMPGQHDADCCAVIRRQKAELLDGHAAQLVDVAFHANGCEPLADRARARRKICARSLAVHGPWPERHAEGVQGRCEARAAGVFEAIKWDERPKQKKERARAPSVPWATSMLYHAMSFSEIGRRKVGCANPGANQNAEGS